MGFCWPTEWNGGSWATQNTFLHLFFSTYCCSYKLLVAPPADTQTKIYLVIEDQLWVYGSCHSNKYFGQIAEVN